MKSEMDLEHRIVADFKFVYNFNGFKNTLLSNLTLLDGLGIYNFL